MMKNVKTAALMAALLTVSASAYADELTSFSMPDVVVYADAASTPDTTIDVHKVNIGAAKTVPELLRGAAGLQIQTRPNSGGNEDLTVKLRGHDSRHFTVLVDGVPQSMSGVMGGGYVNWNAIPLNMVEKIEIIKGAKSAAFGQTEGGVINIVTKRGNAQGGQLELTAGSEGRRQYSFSYGANAGDLGFSVYANKAKQDAYLRNSDYDNEQEGFSLRYNVSKTDKLKFNFDHQELRRGLVVQNIPGGATDYDPSYPVTPNGDSFASSGSGTPGDGSYTKIMRNNFNIAWDNQRDGGSDTFIYWRNHEKQREYNVNDKGNLIFDRYNVTDKSSGFVYNGAAQVSDKHKLGYGADYKRLRYGYGWYNVKNNNASDLYPSQKVDTLGVYVEDNWTMDDRWQVNTGLRYDNMKGDKDAAQAKDIGSMNKHALSPKLNVTLKNDAKTTTALSINHIWRAPSMAEFYWHYAGSGIPNNFSSQIPLNPEKGWGYEASLTHKFSDKFTSKASAFYQDIDDYINFTHTRPFNAYNIDKAQLWGFELENTYKMDDASSLFLNYTNMHTSKDGVAAGDNVCLKGELDYRPRHTLALGYQYDQDKWHVRYDITYTSSQKATLGFPATAPGTYQVQEIGGYMVHNASATYDITKNSSVNFALYNIFDKNYSEIYGYPMEGRVFTATFTQKF